MPNIDKKKAEEFVKGFNAGGPSFSEAIENLKNAFTSDEERKKKKKAAEMLTEKKTATSYLTSE